MTEHGDMLWSTRSSWDQLPTLLAGRYRVLRLLGEGAAGEVFLAHDGQGDRLVAVKRLRSSSAQARARLHRELAALRQLDLPGVVHILDEGEAEGLPFIVMERVAGEPFPGADRQGEWSAVRAPTLLLLRALARVHEAGIVHRDVKPANVLVRADGTPVLLDFGLARGETIGPTITREGAVLGTPRYLAPEQLRGEEVGPSADLYALGVMLYEALVGRPPFEAQDLEALWRAKLGGEAVPLHQRRPDLPRALLELVDDLLALRPEDRPADAAACLRRLGDEAPEPGVRLPWLGPRGPVEDLLHAARAGRPGRVSGPAGSGRTRVLLEVARALQAEGRPVAWTVVARQPFESLAPLRRPIAVDADATLVRAQAQADLEAFLAEGVLMVDGPVDRWSQALLDRAPGPVLCSALGEGLAPLSVVDLRPLFRGPDRILHLAEDAAAELHRRSGGLPRRVDAELRAWLRAGLARWSGERLALGRADLDRLRAGARVRPPQAGSAPRLEGDLLDLLVWAQLAGACAEPGLLARLTGRPPWQLDLELEALEGLGHLQRASDGALLSLDSEDLAAAWPTTRRREAHAALAHALPRGAEGRLSHLIAAGLDAEIGPEARAAAAGLRARGRVGEAEGVLMEALRSLGALPADDDRELERWRLLSALARAAVAGGTVAGMAAAADLARQAGAVAVQAVLDAHVEGRSGDAAAALARLEALGPQADPDLEQARQQGRVQCAQRLGGEIGARVLADLRTWAATASGEDRARMEGWAGLLAFRAGRHAEAATLHESSAQGRQEQAGRLSARLNAAMAWLEAGELDRAEAAARATLAEARAARAPYYEARAEWVGRSVLASRRVTTGADLELVEAVEVMGQGELASLVLCTETVMALLAGQSEAAALAARAVGASVGAGQRWGALWARALQLAADPGLSVDVQSLTAEALACPLAPVGLEVLAILARAGRLPPESLEGARTLLDAEGLSRGSVPRGWLDAAQIRAALARDVEAG